MENLVSSADENKHKNITVEPIFINCKKDNTFIHRQKAQKLYMFWNVIMQV
jgi:hypothetical protein